MTNPDIEIPVFNILSIGLDSAGKTVFLSSLYNKMSVYNAKYGFSLQAEDERQGARLTNLFHRISSPSDPWPIGSMESVEYTFNGLYPTVNGAITFCKFKYLDFPGGLIRAEGNFLDLNLRKRITEAHSVIVLLDGKKIFDALNSKNQAIFKDISFIIPFLNQVIGNKRPVHFVISKCDMLSPEEHSLSSVRSLLFSSSMFADYVRAQANFAKVRLIPVSAVGFNFAKLAPDGHTIEKLENGVANPHNVQFMFSLAINDYFWAMTQKEYHGVDKQIEDARMKMALFDIMRIAPKYLLPRVKRLPGFLFLWRQAGKSTLTRFLEAVDAAAEKRRSDQENTMSLLKSAITDRKQAFIESLTSQRAMIANLDRMMPENDLGKS